MPSYSSSYRDWAADNSERSELDKALGRLQITPERIRGMIDGEALQRKLWHRGTLKKDRCHKYLVEDKKVIASGDIPLGVVPLPAVLVLDNAEYKLIETWNFVNKLFDELRQAKPHEVRKLKKLRRKIAGPMLLGLHLILCIVAHKFKFMKSNMSEQEFAVNPEVHLYTKAADCVWHRFDVVSTSGSCLVECDAG